MIDRIIIRFFEKFGKEKEDLSFGTTFSWLVGSMILLSPYISLIIGKTPLFSVMLALVIFFFSTVFLINMGFDDLIIFAMPVCILLSPLLFLAASCYFLMFAIHNLKSGKDIREQEILEFYEAQIQFEKSKEKTEETPLQKLIKDPEAFISKYNRNSQSLTRFLKERIYDEDGNLDEWFCFQILSLPSHFSIDGIKSILLVSQQTHGSLSGLEFEDFSQESIDSIWKDFPEKKAKYWLTKRFSGGDYISFLNLLYQKKTFNMNAKTLKEACYSSKKREIKDPKLLNLECVRNDQLSFKVLKTYSDYNQAKADFKNCVLSYLDDSRPDIVCCYKSDKPISCISVENRKIKEIKGPYNNSLTRQEEIRIKEVFENLWKESNG